MEKEVSQGVDISVTMISIAAFFGIVFLTVMIGNTMKASGGVMLESVVSSMGSAYVAELEYSGTDNDMPAVAAYSIIKNHEKSIVSVINAMTGQVAVPMLQDIDLRNMLTGRVQLETIEVNGGSFIVLIHNGSVRDLQHSDGVVRSTGVCNWKVGTCTCPYKHVLYTELAKYNVTPSY